MLAKDIIRVIEEAAPVIYQESYDNSGLQVGDPLQAITGVLLTLDVTEAILDEAMVHGCNMIVAHHPLIFSGIKRLSGHTYVERIIHKAIKNDLVIYSAHTNLDNMYNGVNAKIAEKIGLKNTLILSQSSDTLSKLYTYAPTEHADKLREALFAAGAGHIGNYAECSFNTDGNGTFKPGDDTNPLIGEAGGKREWVGEVKVEVLVPKHRETQVIQALMSCDFYEEKAYELIALRNKNQGIGAGIVGELPEPMEETAFLIFLKQQMGTECIRHTALLNKKINKIAVCGGSGSFLLKDAINVGADMFITGDFKYHQFFDADGKIIIADIGHYESEQYTVEIFKALLNEKFPNFAILLSNLSTNPVKYFR